MFKDASGLISILEQVIFMSSPVGVWELLPIAGEKNKYF